MPPQVVVLGSGYAGAGAIPVLEDELDGADLTWVSDVDYHLVLHESHRVIRDPAVRDKIAIPVEDIKSPDTEFVRARVVGVDLDERAVELDGGETLDYDYLLVGLGSRTAFFGIDGLEENAYTLKSLDDALAIHEAVAAAAATATRDDPARVVVGGAGLSGIQSAGEIAAYRDEHDAHLDVYLVEGLDSVFPPGDPDVQGRLRQLLDERDVSVLTGEFINEVDDDRVYVGEDTELPYDVLLWTGGITGRDATAEADIDADERDRRLFAGRDFRTSDDRVFAVGDTAHVDQGDGDEAPPTAVAAWDAAEVAARNVANRIRGQPLETWTYEDKGTLVSVGDEAVAHRVKMPVAGRLPVRTFGAAPARFLKKAAAARWISNVASLTTALAAWDAL